MIEQDLLKLNDLSLPELKQTFLKYFNSTPPLKSKDYYVALIGYRMQELEFGGLSVATKTLLNKMCDYKPAPQKASFAPVGTHIVKRYKGKDYDVRVLEDGFELNGKKFKSLSGVALNITGMKLSGKAFFNLDKWKV